MIKVTIGNNVKRQDVIIPKETTLRKALEDNHIDYTRGQMTLDSAPIQAGDLNKTFADFGFDGSQNHDTCYLLNVVKADNA